MLGDLVEACRVISLAVAPFMPETAARAAEQLGVDYPYGADGNGGPPLLELATWGAMPPAVASVSRRRSSRAWRWTRRGGAGEPS